MEKSPKDQGKVVASSTAQAAADVANDKRLLTLVEAEIIPRLMMAHRDHHPPLASAISSRRRFWLTPRPASPLRGQ